MILYTEHLHDKVDDEASEEHALDHPEDVVARLQIRNFK